jgi:hypothetical protein
MSPQGQRVFVAKNFISKAYFSPQISLCGEFLNRH